MIASDLETALACVEREDLDGARAPLVSAWRAAPQERLARLVELVDARRGAFGDPVASIGDGPAAKARATLEKLPTEPAIATGLLELFAKPPWRANPTLAFWRSACDFLVMTRDPRVLSRLEQVALGYPHTIPTSVGDKVSGYLNGAIARLQDAIAQLPPLDAQSRDACTALEAALGAKAPPKATLGAEIASELLRAIYAAPHDDAPRLVLADFLMERGYSRGDPRGEFINLQLARAAGRADDSTRARELELLAASGGQWTGRIGIAFESDTHVFHRGFVAYAQVPRTKTVLPTVVDDLAWNTLELLDVRMHSIQTTGADALGKIIDTAKGLRGLLGVPAHFLDSRDLSRFERLEGIAIPVRRDRDVVKRWLVDATAPRRLGLVPTPYKDPKTGNDMSSLEPKHLAEIVGSPGFTRLDTIVLESPGQLARWLLLFEPMPLRRIVFLLRGGLRIEVTRNDGRFTRVVFWRPSDLAQSMFPPDDISWALRSLGRRVDAVVDVRTPFYPGIRRTYGHPTKATLRLVEGVVDDLDAL